MRTTIFSVALATGILCAFAASAASNDSSELVRTEAMWSKAQTMKDTATIGKIVAPDWTGQNQSGKLASKATMLADLKNGVDTTSAMTNHDVHVRIIGDIAIVQGSDDEKSMHRGKDSSGTYSWTDVFQKRAGHWVAIASQVTPVTAKK